MYNDNEDLQKFNHYFDHIHSVQTVHSHGQSPEGNHNHNHIIINNHQN